MLDQSPGMPGSAKGRAIVGCPKCIRACFTIAGFYLHVVGAGIGRDDVVGGQAEFFEVRVFVDQMVEIVVNSFDVNVVLAVQCSAAIEAK